MLGKRTIFGKQVKAITTIALILVSVLTLGATLTALKVSAAPTCENMTIAGVSASGYETANPPTNAIDNNLRTRWSNPGFGSWITTDLVQQKIVCSVDIAWYKGDTRMNSFVISVSSDGTGYANVYSGKSSGKTTGSERYSFTETTAKYVRITVTGTTNGNNQWVSINEIDFNGYTPIDTTAPAVTITSPTAGSIVISTINTITIQGTSSDNIAVKIVEVRIDDGSYLAATPKASGDWSSWTVTIPITSGSHRIVPRATDNAGNQAWNSISITAIIDATAPSVAITSPLNGATVSLGALVVQGIAADNTGGSGIGNVQVRIDSGSYITAAPKSQGDWSTWTASINIPNEGSYTVTARATDKAGNTQWHNVYFKVSSSSFDKFGIKKLYPTKSGGNEWYVNMDDPRSDPNFRNLPSMTKQSDGSWQVSASQVRMEAWSPSDKKWLNVEITGYAKMVSGSNELLQWYSRGGHHTSSNKCLGSAYKARLYGDGEARWVKEVTHPAYTSNRGSVQATTTALDDRWIGFKAVIYNFVENGKTYVRMESYIDDDVTDSNGNLVIGNNWKLASVVEDRGGWSTTNSDFNQSCVPMNKDSTQQYRQRDEILNLPGGTSTQNIAAWRSDGLTWNWKYLSVREIVPT